MNNARAVRYRRLALAEEYKAKADLLLKLTDECDRGILCTTEWLSARPYRKDEQPRDAKARFAIQKKWRTLKTRPKSGPNAVAACEGPRHPSPRSRLICTTA
jgi:hypothetical protein